MTIRIKVCAWLDKQYLYEYGKEAGLSDEAAEEFSFFDEIYVDLLVDGENGFVCDLEIDKQFLRLTKESVELIK